VADARPLSASDSMSAGALLCALVAGFVLGPPAAAQNLLQNPRFDTDLTSWSGYASLAPDPVGTGVHAWSTQDVDGSPTSGSALVEFAGTPTGGNAAFGVSQCVDLTAVQPVTSAVFGTRVLLPAEQTADGGTNVTIEVAFFAAAGCTGALITGGSQGKNVLAPDLSDSVWSTTEIVLPGFDIAPLDSPLSAQLRLVVRRVGSNANTLDAFFDQPYFAVNGNVPVELLRFEVE
jgi:hypothetical protein